jgi:hypothetical protein
MCTYVIYVAQTNPLNRIDHIDVHIDHIGMARMFYQSNICVRFGLRSTSC